MSVLQLESGYTVKYSLNPRAQAIFHNVSTFLSTGHKTGSLVYTRFSDTGTLLVQDLWPKKSLKKSFSVTISGNNIKMSIPFYKPT